MSYHYKGSIGTSMQIVRRRRKRRGKKMSLDMPSRQEVIKVLTSMGGNAEWLAKAKDQQLKQQWKKKVLKKHETSSTRNKSR